MSTMRIMYQVLARTSIAAGIVVTLLSARGATNAWSSVEAGVTYMWVGLFMLAKGPKTAIDVLVCSLAMLGWVHVFLVLTDKLLGDAMLPLEVLITITIVVIAVVAVSFFWMVGVAQYKFTSAVCVTAALAGLVFFLDHYGARVSPYQIANPAPFVLFAIGIVFRFYGASNRITYNRHMTI